MAWFYLFIAGIFEVVWATFMKLSDGFSNLGYSIATFLGMLFSFLFLARATHQLPISLAHPVWTGIGALGTVIIGVILFGDHLSPLTWFFVALLLIGIIGIKLTAK